MPRRQVSPTLQLEQSLLYRFSVISNRVAARLFAFYSQRYGLTLSAWRALAHLAEFQPMNPRDIARRAAMDSVSVTRALNELDELGMITRTIDEQDRRRLVLQLSRKGREAYEAIAPQSVKAERELFGVLSAAERAKLGALTQRVMEASGRLFGGGERILRRRAKLPRR